MPTQEANLAAITYPKTRRILSELALGLARGIRADGLTDPIDRMIYFAAMIGTIDNQPLNLSGLALATGLDRKTVRKHVGSLAASGVLLVLSKRRYVVAAAFANGALALARTAAVIQLVVTAYLQLAADGII